MPVTRLREISGWLWPVILEVRGTAASNVLIICVSFGAALLAARVLGPEHRGTLAAAVVYAALAGAIADAGLNQAVPYFAARHRPDAAAVLGTTCALALALGVTSAAAAYLVLTLGRADPRALIYLPSIPFVLLTTHLAGFMYGGGMLPQFNVVRTLQPTLLLVALISAVIAGQPDVSFVLVVAVALSAVLAGAAVVIVARPVPIRMWRVDARIAKGLLSYALQSYIGNLCWLMNSRLDQLMMSFLLPAASLGIYATSVSYATVVFSFFSAFAMLTFAKASAVAAHDVTRVHSIVRRYLIIAGVLGVPTAAGLVAAAPWLYPLLFGDAFAAGVRPAMLLCAAGVFLGLNYILSNGLRILNRPLLPSIAEGVGLAVSVVGLMRVLPAGGIQAVAFVPLISYGTVFAMLVYFTRSHRLAAEPPPVGSAL